MITALTAFSRRVPLDYRAKATTESKFDGADVVYDLNARAYNDIVERTSYEMTMTLVSLRLPSEFERWHEATADTARLRHWFTNIRR
jgi:hypothetical protein